MKLNQPSEDFVPLSQVRKVIEKLEELPEDTPVTFEFMMTAFFPSIWYNINKKMDDYYMRGYLQGLNERKENEN